MDTLRSTIQWTNRHRYAALMMVVGLAVSAWLIGCDATTASVLEPNKQITRPELQRETVTIQAEYERALAVLQAEYEAKAKALAAADVDLSRQEEMRAKVAGILTGVAQAAAEGGMTPAAGINAGLTLLGLFGLGAVADRRRKTKSSTEAVAAKKKKA